jgi:sortase B
MDRGRRYIKVPMVRKRSHVRIILLLIFIVCLAVGVAGLTIYFIRSTKNRAEQADLAALHQSVVMHEQTPTMAAQSQTPTVAPTYTLKSNTVLQTQPALSENSQFFQVIGVVRKAFKTIAERNTDAVGWITIDGLVDQPIVYRNNTFYLDHDFDQRKNVCGAVFLDVNHPIRASTQNLLLYGHNMKDESMFGQLPKYLKDNFLRTHFKVTLETRFEIFTYLIFAVDRVSMDETSSNFLCFWGYPSFSSEESFRAYIEEIYQKSLYTRFLDIDYSDTLLTIATCIGEDRLVLFARRQRASDTQASIQTALLGLTMH